MRCWQFGLFLLFSLVSLDVWAQDLPDIERLLEGNDILNTEDGYEECYYLELIRKNKKVR